jgi:hypothetical protein
VTAISEWVERACLEAQAARNRSDDLSARRLLLVAWASVPEGEAELREKPAVTRAFATSQDPDVVAFRSLAEAGRHSRALAPARRRGVSEDWESHALEEDPCHDRSASW